MINMIFLPEPTYFVTGWVRGLVKIDHPRTDVGFEIALEGSAAVGDGSEVTSSYEY